jgi:hypothetical protein
MGTPGINISNQFHSLKILASQIKRELDRQTNNLGHCAIYEEELQRIWPLDEKDRERKIAEFSREYGFHLHFYKQGLCAIFIKEPPNISV